MTIKSKKPREWTVDEMVRAADELDIRDYVREHHSSRGEACLALAIRRHVRVPGTREELQQRAMGR